jgi:hypothetical protein
MLMQNNRVVQNTSDIQPAQSRQSFGVQTGAGVTSKNSKLHNNKQAEESLNNQDILQPENFKMDSMANQETQNKGLVNPPLGEASGKKSLGANNFEDSFLAEVEESKEKVLAEWSAPKDSLIQQPKEINLGIIQNNSSDSSITNLKIQEGIQASGNSTEIKTTDEHSSQMGYRENFNFSENNIQAEIVSPENNVKIGSINYGTHSNIGDTKNESTLVTAVTADNVSQEYFAKREEKIIDKKIGNFLNPKKNQLVKHANVKNEGQHAYVEGKKSKKKKSFLPSIITDRSLSITPFATGVLVVSLAIMITGFVSFGFQAKDDIEVRGVRAVNYIKEAKVDLQNKNFELATTNLVSAKQEFKDAQNQIDKLGGRSLDIFAHIPFLSKISSGKNVVALGDGLTDAVVQLSKVSELLAGVGNPLDLKDEGRSSLTDIFIKVQESINLSKESLHKAEMASVKINVDDLPLEHQEKIKFIKEFLPLVNDSLDEFDRAAEIFLELFGHNGQRKYLIVFQNNQEMRATGGFIGSYGLLETSQGRIDRLKIEGIYHPDGQLKVDVVPPRPIQKISASWSTHDANWWPDFPKSAEKISWFYEKTGGPTVDGVIAVTPVLLQKMLEVTGPIEMSEYNKTITSKNVIKEIQQEVEVDYKENVKKNANIESGDEKIGREEVVDPKKILADLTPILFAKFFDLEDPKQAGKVIKILLDTLKEKQVLINFKDNKVQEVVATQGWAGEILKTEKDYLMVINSNINGHKTDGVIEENIKHQAEIQADGSVIDTVVITRKHNGGNTEYEWWNKVNADYMRVYVPQGSKLISAEGYTREVNDERLNYDKLGFQIDADVKAEENYMEIDKDSGTRIYEENNKTVFANWVYVSPQERVTVIYKYLLPFKVDITDGKNNRYSLLMQKQSGSVNSTIKAEIEFPFAWDTTWVEPKNLQLDKRNGKLLFSHELDTDQFIGAVFKQ